MVSNPTNIAINLEKQAITFRKLPNKNDCDLASRLSASLIGASLNHHPASAINRKRTFEDEK